MAETPSMILISCIAVMAILLGGFFVATSVVNEYNLTSDESFKNSMDKSGALNDQVDSMNEKLDSSKGMQDPGTGSLLFDGLNTIVLGVKATRAIVGDFVQTIGLTLGIPTILIKLIVAMLLIVIIAAILSALWSRDV